MEPRNTSPARARQSRGLPYVDCMPASFSNAAGECGGRAQPLAPAGSGRVPGSSTSGPSRAAGVCCSCMPLPTSARPWESATNPCPGRAQRGSFRVHLPAPSGSRRVQKWCLPGLLSLERVPAICCPSRRGLRLANESPSQRAEVLFKLLLLPWVPG